MLAYFLSILVGIGSVGLYFIAFLLPEIHRKYDFAWSGLGLFYALVLWIEANQLTGGLLLGQLASVILLGYFGWQTISLRQQLTPADRRTSWRENLSLGKKLQFSKSSLTQLDVDELLPVDDRAIDQFTPSAWIEIRQDSPAEHQKSSD